jgi:hypothetical protein
VSDRGDRVPLGLDLEWERTGPVVWRPDGAGYELGCAVHGEVLVGRERLAFEGTGSRSHVWGEARAGAGAGEPA